MYIYNIIKATYMKLLIPSGPIFCLQIDFQGHFEGTSKSLLLVRRDSTGSGGLIAGMGVVQLAAVKLEEEKVGHKQIDASP